MPPSLQLSHSHQKGELEKKEKKYYQFEIQIFCNLSSEAQYETVLKEDCIQSNRLDLGDFFCDGLALGVFDNGKNNNLED